MREHITRSARAKVNLYLHVTGRRADGYHTLDSLVAFTRLADRVTVSPAEGLDLAIDGPFAADLGAPRKNLVWRAAEALADADGVPADAEIRLTKRLPVAAGLGGGSADAAAVLLALRLLWQGYGTDVAALATRLGADVPVCLAGVSAFVGGIGEEITPAPELPAAALVLVNPGTPLATSKVFDACSGNFSQPKRFSERPGTITDLAILLGHRRNDLTAAAVGLCPPIGLVLAALEAAPGCHLARMSGSGATCFGLFDDLDAARHGAATVARPDWWVEATCLEIAAENADPSNCPE